MRVAPVVLVLVCLASCAKKPVPVPDSIAIAVPYELTSLDPDAHDKLSSFSILSNVYEPLVRLDADMRILPGLATSWESPDPLDWVFHLRPGVFFQSGRPLRAADVVYSLERVLHGRDLEMSSYVLGVSRVTRLDDLTVRVKTERPSRILLNKLSGVLIVPEGATSEALQRSADGTGPYALVSWTPQSVLLRRNGGHWRTPLPFLREARFVLGRSPDESLGGLLAGRYQLIQSDSKKIGVVVESSERYAMLRRDNLYVKYLGYDLARDATPHSSVKPNPFRNPLVRRALHVGIDRHRLVSELSNYAVPALQPVPRFVFGFNPQIPEPSYDKDEARRLLKEAGLSGGFGVVLHVRRMFAEAAALVREELVPLGIRVDVKALPDPEFFGALERRDATFWLNRFGCSTGDASDFLDDAVHSRDPSSHFGTKNYGWHSDRDADRAIEGIADLEKVGERRGAVQGAVARSMADLVVVPLYNDQDIYGIDVAYAWEPRSDSYIQGAEIGARAAARE